MNYEVSFIRISRVIITFFFLFISLFYLKELLVPIVYAMIIAMLFVPLSRFLEKKKVPRGWAITICLLLIIIAIISLLFLLYSQLASIGNDFPLFEKKAWEKFSEIQKLIESLFHVSTTDQTIWLKNNYSKIITFGSDIVKQLLLSLSGGLELFLLVIIYVFFFLLLRDRFKKFTLKLFSSENHPEVINVITKTEVVTRKYMSGQLKVMAVIGILNAIGFMICGVKQAIFWGFLRGLLNIIPYVGAILGAIFPVLSVAVYKDGIIYPIGVVSVVLITQLLQDNFLVPKIIGSNIRLNPLTTIMAIIIGGMLWGINGMILLLPLTGIIKIICDNVAPLKPFGYLLGEEKD
jgi:predicted PurR-regulated permease PerM